MEHEIKLIVTDEQLKLIKQQVEEDIGGTVLDPLKLLTALLQQDARKDYDCYIRETFGEGELGMGDVLEGDFSSFYQEDCD